MSIQLAHPPLPGETPFEWADRVRGYYPATRPTATTRSPAAAAKPAKRLQVVRTVARCTYCGAATARRGGPVACHAHRDLIHVDPLFTAAYTEPAKDFRPEALLDGLVTNGG